MIQRRTFLKGSLAALGALAAPAWAQTTNTIEAELSLITPVSKFIHDAALEEFAKYAKERWKISVKTSALAAGTPVAYGRIVEWKGRPEVDIFWGGESALFDKLAEQKLIAPLNLPKAAIDAIPATIGKPKPIYLRIPRAFGPALHWNRTAWCITRNCCNVSACHPSRTGTICSIRNCAAM